ncbi:MAG: site-specific integrase [Planctomycetaceae bacterium]|nr:site-specific integrase [Planctomycetaceae bacterium]
MRKQKKNRLPGMCKDRNQALSWYKGKRYYHGVWGSPEADRNYKRFITKLLEKPDLTLQVGETGDVLVSELTAGFVKYIESRNVEKTEILHFKRVIGFLVETYGEFAVNEFSPKKLKICRNQMVQAGTLSRPQINKHIGRIIRIFAWGVEEEYVQPSIVAALREVKNLQRGEKGTFDNPPRLEVPDAVVKQTLLFMVPTIAAMVQVQGMTGMRPSEIYRMTVGDIDLTSDPELWYYTPKNHKTEQFIGGKQIPLGKPEQELIAPYLVGKSAEESVFSPRQAVRERREQLRAERKSKLTPSQRKRDEQRAKYPAEKIGDFYDKHSYRRAIEHAIKKGNKTLPVGEEIPTWTPYQLRHAAATAIEKEFGLDKAQAQLGHKTANMTKRYAHAQLVITEELARNRKNPFVEDEKSIVTPEK